MINIEGECSNTAYKILEKNKRNDYGNMDTIEECSPYVDSAEETALSEISYDELKSSVDELNPRYKLILNMKSMGYNNKEIAEELNVKSGTVRVMLVIFKKIKGGKPEWRRTKITLTIF